MNTKKRIAVILMSVLLLLVIISDTLDTSDTTAAPLAASYSSFILLFIIIMQENHRRTVRRIQNRKKRGRKSTMKQLIERFLNKEVSVASIVGTLRGTLVELSDNAVAIEGKNGTQVVNIDYIYSVKEVKSKK